MVDGPSSTIITAETIRAAREAAGPPPNDCGCWGLGSDGKWFLNWGRHDGRCHVPLVERIEALEARVAELEQRRDESRG